MKLSIPNSVLLPAVSALRGIIQGVRATEVTSFLLFHYSGDRLSITAADTDIEMTIQLDAANLTADKPGAALIPAKKLLGIVFNSSENETTTINIDDDVALVSGDRSRFKLMSLEPEGFPLMEKTRAEGGMFHKVRADDFQHLLSKTDFSMAQDDARYYLEGLLLTQENGYLVAVSTDGHRLSTCQIEHGSGKGQDARVILPRRAVYELKRILPQADETISVGIGEKQVCVRLGAITLTTKLIEGSKYPDYKRVIPSDFVHKVNLDSGTFRRMLAKAQIIEDGLSRLRFDKGKLTVISETDYDGANIEQDIEYSGEKIEIGFNLQYLMDVMNAVTSEQILFEIKDPNSAVQIRENDAGKFIVMPMRL